jgi:predicted NBD/HSP70 family sugar kinase
VIVAAPQVVLGLDYGGTKIAAAVGDLAGNHLASTTTGSGGALGAQASFGRGVQVARDLLHQAAPGSELVAVGVSTFGIPFEDRVELAPAIEGWDKLAMGRELRAAFPGTQIRMATDAKAAAQAEVRWGALADRDPAVYLNLGTGLAAAVVIGGQVVTGVNGAAGEIGYNLRSMADVGLALDRRSLLEHMVSGQALADRAARDGRAGPALTAADVFAGGSADPELDGLINDFVDELAYHLVNLAILVNPARIAVGGGIVRSWARIRPRLQHALRAGTPFPPELVVAHFPYDAPLLGAVAMAVDAASGQAGPARRGGPDRDATHREAPHQDRPHQDGQHQNTPTADTVNTGTLS